MKKSGDVVIIFVLVLLLALSFVQADPVKVILDNTTKSQSGNAFFLKNDLNTTITSLVFNKDLTAAQNYTNCSLTLLNPQSELLMTNTTMQPGNEGLIFFQNISKTNLTDKGIYSGLIYCLGGDYQKGATSFQFLVNPAGTEPTLAYAFLYLGLLLVLVFFLCLSILAGWNLDGENKYDFGGKLVEVNINKHFKIGLFFLSYLLLIFVVFVSLAIAKNFLFLESFSGILNIIHLILWFLLAPVFLAFVAHSLIKFAADLELQKLAERNLPQRKK